MFDFWEKLVISIGVFFLLFVLLVVGAFFVDISDIKSQSVSAALVDKWHEYSCSPLIGSNGEYLGENCSDEYTLVLLVDGERKEVGVSGKTFRNSKSGSEVIYTFGVGRLGFEHTISVEPKNS